jgi:predicted Zn-dependent peptidase
MANLLKKSDCTWLPRIFFVLLVFLSWSFSPTVAQGLTTTETNAASIKPYLDRVVEKVTEFTLDNGMKFIILENHQAPVVSFVTYANVGGVNEPDGKTGVAHFLEHLAFKGTEEIGTTSYIKEKPLLDRLDLISVQIQAASAAGNKEEVQRLQQKFTQKENEAQQYVKQNEYGQIVETAGGVGVNASTTNDSTQYFYSFPSNKLELWMSLESERFLHPVFREFYKEQQVILEERRMRNDNSPIGKMVEAFLDTAFTVHPYKRPVIGYDRDIRNLTRKDVEEFFATYYGPGNITIAIVGDVDPQEVEQLAQVYFGRYQPKPAPPKVTKIEPPQLQTREVTLKLSSQPWYLEGYHIRELNHPDYVVYEMISGVLSGGRTSRLYKSLVQEKQIALTAEGDSGFPGDKYPNLMLLYAMTAPNHTVDEVAVAFGEEIERLKNELVTDEELNQVKTQARADLLRALDSNIGMAKLLAEYQAKTGSWRNLFEELDAIAAVTPEDIRRVAKSIFNQENRTFGRLLSSEN